MRAVIDEYTHECLGIEVKRKLNQMALLMIYNMCKAVDRGMEIGNIRLVYKSSGKSGAWNRATSIHKDHDEQTE